MIQKARTGIEDDELAEQVGIEAATVAEPAMLRNFEGEIHKGKKAEVEELIMEGKRARQSRVVEIDGFPVLISTIDEVEEVDSEDESPYAAKKRMHEEQRAWKHQNECFSCKKGPYPDRYLSV
jgi:hypothetical protein